MKIACTFASVTKSRDCVDCNNVFMSELCYECVNIVLLQSEIFRRLRHLHRLCFSSKLSQRKNSMFCYGLDHKEFCLFQRAARKEEYKKRVQEFHLDSFFFFYRFGNIEKRWEEFSAQWPKIRHGLNSENCEWWNPSTAQKCLDAYNVSNLEDCRYILNSVDVKDSYDFYAYGMKTELCYEAVTIANCYDLKFCNYCMFSNSLEYCESCWSCEDCFGCIGLKKAKFHIFNKTPTARKNTKHSYPK